MDSGELEESSSSPSANPYIQSVKEGAVGTRAAVLLTDGSSFYVRPEFLRLHELQEGVEVDGGLYELLTDETLFVAAKQKAVDYLARREHSAFELKRKLLHKDFPVSVVEKVLEECRRQNYLDDERFTRIWAESRIRRKAEGPLKVAAKLSQKGVAQGIVERVLAELFTDEQLEESITRAVEKGRKKGGEDSTAMKKFLLARGFTLEQINRYIR